MTGQATDERNVLVAEVEGFAVKGVGGEQIDELGRLDGDHDEGKHWSAHL